MKLVFLFILCLLATFKQCSESRSATALNTVPAQLAATKGILAAAQLSRTNAFTDALKDLRTAEATDHKEHAIAFGKDVNDSIISSAIADGNINSGAIPSIINRCADLHIHIDESPPSSGDIYGFIDQSLIDTNYIRYITTPNGVLYALVLIDNKLAANFNQQYPRRPGMIAENKDGSATKYQPTFPSILIDEFDRITGWGGATKEQATAFILTKYKAGIALLKKDDNGNFRRLITKETIDHKGNKIYSSYNCE